MKTSIFKKIIAITLSLTLIMSCMMISMPHIHAATSVDFLWEDDTNETGKRLGIQNIIIDNTNYYDIDGGKSTIDPTEITPVELYKSAMTADYNGYSVADMWANVASMIFESAGTDFGYNDDSFSSTFDDYLVEDTGDDSDINLFTELSASDGLHKNAHTHGRARTTGWTVATDLKSAQTKMISEVAQSFADNSKEDVNTSDVLSYSTGKSDGFDLLNNTDRKDVLYNIVTTSNYDGGANKAYYSSFGMVFYDFELIPLADDDLEFITAAEGYASLEEAANDENAEGIEYNDTGSGNPHTSYVTNPSSSDSVVSASYSETHSTTVSNYMESSETYTFGQSTEVSTEFSASFPLVSEAKTSISVGFSAEQAISTAYGEEESLTKETTTETVAEVNLPAHTQMGITQQTGTTEIVFTYDCPVYLTYKAAIFAMNGEFYLDSLTVERWGDAGYDTGGMCIGFGTDNSTGGLTAIDNLYNRAVRSASMEGFETSYGNCEGYWEKDGDGNASKRYTEVDWLSFINDKQKNGANLTAKECVTRLKNNIPLSAAGGKMSVMSTSMTTDITSIMPLHDLDYIQADGSSVYTIAPGGTVDFSKIATNGYNEYDIPYYGYISDGGSWVLCDADGNELTSVDGAAITDVGNYQKLTADKVGTYYAKFLIDESLYSKVEGSGKITNADLSSTAIITINVTETGLDHICTEGPWETTIASTCTAEGEQVAKCMTCGRVMYTQTVAKLDHIPVTITTPATCTAEGNIREICGVCLGLISSESIEKLEHDEGVWKIDFEATADHHGQMSRYCTMCDTALESKEFELHTHEFGYESISREPTCVANGEKGLFCSICNAMYATEQIEKSGHGAPVFVTTIQPTCTQPGEAELYCEDCGGLIGTNEIEAHGHAAAWITVKEADCKTIGREEYTCTICKAVLETREIAKTEHVPGKWEITQQPTCTVEGLKQQTCAICGALVGEPVIIPAHDHDNGAWKTVLEATCTTDGEKVRECTICKGTIESEIIPALGHDNGVWTTVLEATCETPGERHKNCTRCGQLIESERIDALGHTPGPAMTCATDQVCLVCEEVLVPADGKSHTWTDWETYKEASFFVEEQQRRVCTSCDLEEYRFVKGTSKCHKYFPHCGDGEDCWACNTLSNTNGFFRNLGKFLTWFFFENIITTILFPFAHGHFHELINLDKIFGS